MSGKYPGCSTQLTTALEWAQGWDQAGEYHAAERAQPSLQDKLSVAADLTLATLQFVVVSAFLMVKALMNLLTPQTPKDIRGKLVLVTGGGNGLGRELCLEVARCGARLCVADVDERAARRTAAELGVLGAAARAYVADVSSPEQVRRLREQIYSDWNSPVDILFNNAGLLAPVSLLNGEDADIDRVIDVNLKSHFWMLRTFLPAMVERGGHVVSISSMAGLAGLSRAVAYTATKFGVSGLALALRAELRDAGVGERIRVTIAYPYFLTTRKELIDNINLRIPAICPGHAARQIVAAVRRNRLQVGVPLHFPHLAHLISMLPDEVEELFRKTFYSEIKM